MALVRVEGQGWEIPHTSRRKEPLNNLTFRFFWQIEPMNQDQVVTALSALAHPIRLQVFRALVVSGNNGLTPGVMQEGLGIPSTTLSFHLKELANAGLVTTERASRHLVYRAVYAQMTAIIGFLTENCCQGADCDVPSDAAACDC